MEYKWYIVNALSGYEKKVAAAIEEQSKQKGLAEHFEVVTVPEEEVVEVRKGKKINAAKKFFPGYVMLKMHLNDKTWHLVKNIPKVKGFLGGSGKPQPISQAEADRIFKQVEEGVQHPKNLVTFEIGEAVKIIDGPFDTFVGVVEEIDEEKLRLKVAVSILGRTTPVELDYTQVEKV